MDVEQLAVSYWEGRDPDTGEFVGPLSTELAADRDRDEEQYSVLVAAAGRPVVQLDIAWRDAYCLLTFFADSGHVDSTVDCRRLAEDFVLVYGGLRWEPGPDPATGEARATQRFYVCPDQAPPDDVLRVSLGPDDKTIPRWGPADAREYWVEVPAFGEWIPFIDRFPYALAAIGVDLADGARATDVSDPQGTGLPPDQRPWTSPRPVAPWHLEHLAAVGTRFTITDVETGLEASFTIEVEDAGLLRLPTGRLVATGPWCFRKDVRPYSATVPPGEYPVVLSLARWDDEWDWREQENQRRASYRENLDEDDELTGLGDRDVLVASDGGPGRSIAAARVVIRDEPVATWEMAVEAGTDVRLFMHGEMHCMTGTRGLASYLDASARSTFADLHDWFDITSLRLDENMSAILEDPASGANLVVYRCGWGEGCVTWTGRNASGDIVCFLTDMNLASDIDGEFHGYRLTVEPGLPRGVPG